MKVNITSDDINLLVYRYLIENGYTHTAFCFNKEADIPRNPYYNNHAEKLPPNALVAFVQKAMIYIYIEYHTDELSGEQVSCDEPFSFFKKHVCFRKVGQQRGLPIRESMLLTAEEPQSVSPDNDEDYEVDGDGGFLETFQQKDQVTQSAPSHKPPETEENNDGNALPELHPIYVGPPQRRLAEKWQLMHYMKLLDYASKDYLADAYFNPTFPNFIAKRVENAPPALYNIANSKKSSTCEIVPPDVTLTASDDNPNTPGTVIKWRPDGKLLCTGYTYGTVSIWSHQGQRLFRTSIGNSAVTSVAFSGSYKFWRDSQVTDPPCKLAVGDAQGNFTLFSLGQTVVLIASHNQGAVVSEISWRDHNLVAIATTDARIRIHDTVSNQTAFINDMLESNPQFMEWATNGKCLAVVDRTNVLKLYKPGSDPTQGDVVTLKAHTKPIVAACWQFGSTTKTTNKLCTIALDKHLFVWDVVTETVVASMLLDQVPTTISINSEDTAIAVGTYGNCIKIYSLPSLTLTCSVCDQELPTSITWEADANHIAYNVYSRQRTLVVPVGTSPALVSE